MAEAAVEFDIDKCEDEDELRRVLTKTDDISDRQKLRARLKQLRDAETANLQERQKQRQETNIDTAKFKAELAEKEKARKMQDYQKNATPSVGLAGGDDVGARKMRHDAEKEATMKQFTELGKAPGPGEFQGGVEKLKRLEHDQHERSKERTLQSFGKMQVAQHEQEKAKQNKLSNAEKKSVNPFKAMDKANNPQGGAKPNFLTNPPKASGAGVARSPTAIKQVMIDWCKAQTQGYEGVNVQNFSSSWADGLAFCALIHHHYPDAFDFSKLDAKNRRANFALAFDTAEKCADIAPLLEVDDMVMMKTPDWKCVFVYIQSFYRKFVLLPNAKRQSAPPTADN